MRRAWGPAAVAVLGVTLALSMPTLVSALPGAHPAAQEAAALRTAPSPTSSATAIAARRMAEEMAGMDHATDAVATRRKAKPQPRPKLAVTTRQAVIGGDRTLTVQLSCSAARQCRGNRWLALGSSAGKTAYRLSRHRQAKVRWVLTPQQYARIPVKGSLNARVVVRELKPKALKARSFTVTLRRPAVKPTAALSFAYTDRNWTPAASDTCPASLHAKYNVVGPDDKVYPAWHPAEVTDPATGTTCTFGHEHGDDPRTSDIYNLVVDQFRSRDFPDRAGIPFGYVAEQLTAYAGKHAELSTRHEDNVGHKVIVANNVKLVQGEPRGFVYTTDATGSRVPVTCDFLMVVHQGSHSADATMNNAHELIYAMDCNDGTRLVTATMSRFGDPNKFNRSCDPSVVVTTGGSTLPAGDGGERLIPDQSCIDEYVLVDPTKSGSHSDPWGIYEVWRSANDLRAEDGRTLVSFDPWFGVRNPSRYFKAPGVIGFPVTAAWETDPSDNGVTNAAPWLALMSKTPFGQTDPQSPFDGSERDFYLGQTQVANAGGPTYWYTDPYGQHGSTVPFVGSIRQLVSPHTTAYPTLERREFNQQADYGADLHVHAPN